MSSTTAYLDASREYGEFLLDLTFNSKPIIDNLTTIAAENKHAAAAIVSAIESRIAHVSPDKKLPALYLLDSIVKNIGEPYRSLFQKNLQTTFLSAFRVVPKAVRYSMMRLLETWPPYFGNHTISMLKVRANELHKNLEKKGVESGTVHVNPQILRNSALESAKKANAKTTGYNVPYLERAKERIPAPRPKENQIPAFTKLQLQQSQTLSQHQNLLPPSTKLKNYLPFLSQSADRSDNYGSSYSHPRVPDTSQELVRQLQSETQLLIDTINSQMNRGLMPTQEQLNALQALVTVQLQYSSFNALAQSFVPTLQQSVDDISVEDTARESTGTRTMIAHTIQSLMLGYSSQTDNFNVHDAQKMPHSGVFVENVPSSNTASGLFQEENPLIDDFSLLRKVHYRPVVTELYDKLPLISESDGARFATRDILRQHLDWLFERNKRMAARKQGGTCRLWYSTASDWIQGSVATQNSGLVSSSMIFDDTGANDAASLDQSDGSSADELEQSLRDRNKVVAGDCEDVCFVCGDTFEMEWDDALEALVYRDAVKEGDDDNAKIFHVDCYSTWVRQNKNNSWNQERSDEPEVTEHKNDVKDDQQPILKSEVQKFEPCEYVSNYNTFEDTLRHTVSEEARPEKRMRMQ
eukprot:jgi/Galph1/979/GphlegSOOS_G5624.1